MDTQPGCRDLLSRDLLRYDEFVHHGIFRRGPCGIYIVAGPGEIFCTSSVRRDFAL